MIPAALHAKPGHLIRRAHQIAVAIFLDECRDFGVTPVQYGVLRALDERPGTDQATLGRLVALDRSTLADVAARLEDRGLIRRDAGADRRVKLLSLTAEGAALLTAAEDAVERAQRRLVAPLAPAERERFLELLDKLVAENGLSCRVTTRQVAGEAP